MKKLNLNLLTILFALTTLVACKKDNPSNDTTDGKPIDKIVVPANFDWEATKIADLEIEVGMLKSIGELVFLKVYDGNPAENGQLLLLGSAGYESPFKASLRIPLTTNKIWIEAQGQNGVVQTATLDVASSIKYSFAEPEGGYKSAQTLGISEPECEGEITISGNSQVTISGGKTYLISGSYSGNLNFASNQGGGTLIICGTADLNSLNIDNNCRVAVTSTGNLNCQTLTQSGSSEFEAWNNTTVTIAQVNHNSSDCMFTNYSSNLTISGSMATAGAIYNYGTLNVSGSVNLNPNGYFLNDGTVSIAGSLNINQDFENYGSFSIGSSVNFNTNSSYVNACKISVVGSVNLNSGNLTFYQGYLKAASFTVNGSGNLKLTDKSMLSTGDLMVNNTILATGSKNTILTTGNATINGNKKVSGPVEWADNDAVLSNGNSSNFINGATFVKTSNATNVIPVSECNPVGIGYSAPPDADGDGVNDANDAYPNDATRAFNTYYPNQSAWGSLAFEDLWPATGDYDFNDMVIKYQYKTVTNASNKVVELSGKFEVTAVGAGYKNGFGIQFDNLLPQNIASVSGQVIGENYISLSPNGTEAAQSKTVIIPWDNVDLVINRTSGAMFNTLPDSDPGTADIVEIVIAMNTPVDLSLLGTAPFNPFLIRQMNRGHEIHLIDHIPTSLMDLSLLGTLADKSVPAQGKYFRTSANLPWAISIPEMFDHPIEKTVITDAYMKFSSWAESGATLYNDWYRNNSGYRNSSNIY